MVLANPKYVRMYVWFWPTLRIFGDFPAKNAVNAPYIIRVGQNHIYTMYIRYFWQGNEQIYGHIRCINTVLANPIHNGYRVNGSDQPYTCSY